MMLHQFGLAISGYGVGGGGVANPADSGGVHGSNVGIDGAYNDCETWSNYQKWLPPTALGVHSLLVSLVHASTSGAGFHTMTAALPRVGQH